MSRTRFPCPTRFAATSPARVMRQIVRWFALVAGRPVRGPRGGADHVEERDIRARPGGAPDDLAPLDIPRGHLTRGGGTGGEARWRRPRSGASDGPRWP